ncbi:hypothetical protein EVAR_96494_1 [Eumeta japonica]|uniref:Uncharacterized protein n=1 Tax=Eumeta variegata TaxID=151549 RepID=A0A4C1ZW30_EUMVA|nr:hypothetical protein EVAR_96494_1 [Eumeta japonica]
MEDLIPRVSTRASQVAAGVTEMDATIPLQFIDGVSVCIYINRGAWSCTLHFMHERSFADLLHPRGCGYELMVEPGIHLGRDTALSGLDMATYSQPLGVRRASTGMRG